MKWKKFHAHQLTQKEFDNEKNARGSQIPHPPPPPHNFSNGPFLSHMDMCRSKG